MIDFPEELKKIISI